MLDVRVQLAIHREAGIKLVAGVREEAGSKLALKGQDTEAWWVREGE